VVLSNFARYSKLMVEKNPCQLRDSAQKFRDMCADGVDPELKKALRLLADEFESEAIRIDECQNSAIGNQETHLL
jgi:hypothetical protein